MKTIFVAVRTLLFASGFFYLWVWVARAVERLGLPLPEWTVTPGSVLLALGGVLALACLATFVVRGKGTPAPFDAPREFVAVGPYRYVRNPMYIGGATMLVGFGLYLRSGAVVLFAVAWLGLAHLFVVLYEEPTLRSKFGAAYESYCRAVARWIPRLALVLALGVALGADGKPNFSGEWKLNLDKSRFGALPAPLSRVDTIEHQDPTLRIARSETRASGDAKVVVQCSTAGTECESEVRGVQLNFKGSFRWEGTALGMDAKGVFQGSPATAREKWTLSEDGKTIRIERQLSSDQGSTEQSLVLEKQ